MFKLLCALTIKSCFFPPIAIKLRDGFVTFSLMSGSSNFIVTDDSLSFLKCGTNENPPINSIVLHEVPDVILLKAREGDS